MPFSACLLIFHCIFSSNWKLSDILPFDSSLFFKAIFRSIFSIFKFNIPFVSSLLLLSLTSFFLYIFSNTLWNSILINFLTFSKLIPRLSQSFPNKLIKLSLPFGSQPRVKRCLSSLSFPIFKNNINYWNIDSEGKQN